VDSVTDLLLRFASAQDNLGGLALLAGSAAIEYVFPPFPGDSVTLAGAVLVARYGWSFPLVLAVVMLGSLAGAMLAFRFGGAIEARRSRRLAARGGGLERERSMLDSLVARFRRHGPVLIVVNRFVPGLRAVVFIAAGLAELPPRAVFFYAALSALLWNLALMALGAALGANLDALIGVVQQYTHAALAVVAAIALAIAAVWLVRRRRRQSGPADS
jgi:membrane-associated protein